MSTMEVVGLSNNVEKCRKDLSEERFEGVFDGLFGVVDTFFCFLMIFDIIPWFSMFSKFFWDLDCFCAKLLLFSGLKVGETME